MVATNSPPGEWGIRRTLRAKPLFTEVFAFSKAYRGGEFGTVSEVGLGSCLLRLARRVRARNFTRKKQQFFSKSTVNAGTKETTSRWGWTGVTGRRRESENHSRVRPTPALSSRVPACASGTGKLVSAAEGWLTG